MRISATLLAFLALPAAMLAGSITSTQEVCVTVTSTDLVLDGPSVAEQQFCATVDPETGEFDFSQSEIALGDDFINQLSFGGQVDPFLIYSVGIVDGGAPSSFLFVFSIPVAGGPYNTASHTMSASLTDGGDGSISFTPTGAATDIAFASIDASNLGIDLGGLGCIAGGGSSTCPPGGGGFAASTGFGPSSPATMSVAVAFDGSGAFDTYGVTGSLELDAASVPEPVSAVLGGLGLAGLALLRRRRVR